MVEASTKSTSKNIGIVSLSNSSDKLLKGSAFFTGTYVDCLNIVQVCIIVETDVAGTVHVDHSADGKHITRAAHFDVNGGDTADTLYFGLSPRARYLRIRYENGATPQKVFVLQTILNSSAKGFTFFPIVTSLSDTNHALLTRAILAGKNATSGEYENVSLDDGQNLRVTSIQHVIADPLNTSSTLLGAGPAEWSLTKTYAKSDLVSWKGKDWQSSMGANTGNEPVAGAWWAETISGNHIFTGVSSSTLGVAGIQVTLKTDVNCDVFVDQSPDGTNWDIIDQYFYNSLKGNFGVTTQAVNSYLRVRVRNRNTFAPTYFRLQTCLCPVVEAVPRSLDEELAFKTCIKDIEDVYGHKGEITPLNELKVANTIRITGVSFQATVDANFWTLTNSGAGSAGTIKNIATLTSGTANGGYGQVTSSRKGRFVTGHANHTKCIARIPVVVASNCVRRWGAFSVGTGGAAQTPLDGFYFQLSSAGVLSVNHVKSGAVTSVASGSFNGTRREYSMDMDMHVYDIVFTVFEAKFYIDRVLIHTLTPTTRPLTDNLTVPVTATSINTGIAPIGGTLEVWALFTQRLGHTETTPKWAHIAGAVTAQVLKIGAGRLHKVVYNTFPNGGLCTLYDATVGTNPIAIMAPPNNIYPGTVPYDIDFYEGLTITTVGATMDLTICYE